MVGFYQARLGGGLDQYQNAATDERRVGEVWLFAGWHSRRSRLSVKPLGRRTRSIPRSMTMRSFRRGFLSWIGLGCLVGAISCNPIATSHIEGNVPPPELFRTFLDRDLAKYFSQDGVGIASVTYEM